MVGIWKKVLHAVVKHNTGFLHGNAILSFKHKLQKLQHWPNETLSKQQQKNEIELEDNKWCDAAPASTTQAIHVQYCLVKNG
jgi:hypothetical protein